jgi:hypothetical protein
MEERKLTHLVVYGDREHFANLAYLTCFDPRFEEAVLIVGPNSKPLLVVGNECESYVGVSPLFNDGELPEDVLPLSNIPVIVPPFFLAPNEIFALES